MAFAVGQYHPRDWARLRDSHTDYEWAVQRLCQIIDPIGEERADMRSGAAVSQLARLLAPDSGEDAFQAIGDNARNYLAINVPPDEPVMTPEQAAEYKRRKDFK